MPAPRKYPNELRERAIRLVRRPARQDPSLSLNAAVVRIGAAGRGDTRTRLRGWCKQAVGRRRAARRGRPQRTRRRIKDLEREVRELKRANEILLAASSFFARELDPRLPW